MQKDILVQALYLLALINPISKICVLAVFPSETGKNEIAKSSCRSSAVAFAILLAVVCAGNFVFRDIFRVELYSLKVAGGIVLFWVGFGALTKGVFFEHGTQVRFAEISLVPLACPMIAGPATITAALTLSMRDGIPTTLAAIILALTVNLILMLLSQPIARFFSQHNVLGALIRITGLIVITIGVQMVLDGFAAWRSAFPA
jgi:multiple antibiotic resistance protein